MLFALRTEPRDCVGLAAGLAVRLATGCADAQSMEAHGKVWEGDEVAYWQHQRFLVRVVTRTTGIAEGPAGMKYPCSILFNWLKVSDNFDIIGFDVFYASFPWHNLGTNNQNPCYLLTCFWAQFGEYTGSAPRGTSPPKSVALQASLGRRSCIG